MAALAVDNEHRVTPRELFFDLVFVFAFAQVATLLADDPTFAGIGRGVLVVPGVFDDEGVLFGGAFLIVCAMHLGLFALAGRGSRESVGAVLRLAPWTLLGATLILVAGVLDGARTWLWLAALASTYVAAALSGSTGWQVHPSHFAERYGLMLIIALGEVFISIGIGTTGSGSGWVRSWPRSSGSSSPPRSGSPTSTSSRSAPSGYSAGSRARNAWRSPATRTRTGISR